MTDDEKVSPLIDHGGGIIQKDVNPWEALVAHAGDADRTYREHVHHANACWERAKECLADAGIDVEKLHQGLSLDFSTVGIVEISLDYHVVRHADLDKALAEVIRRISFDKEHPDASQSE